MNVAILLSGGTGTRISSDIPKQYIEVNGRMIIEYSMETLLNSKTLSGVVIVADSNYQELLRNTINVKYSGSKNKVEFVLPGKTRQLSIYNALKSELCSKSKSVFIHDAARPNLTEEMIERYIAALKGYEGVLPVLPMKDTVYEVTDGAVSGLLQREKIFAGQAPEVFLYTKYLEANERLMSDEIYKINGSTEPAILYGMNIKTIEGDENNYKITTDADLVKFRKSKVME